ncbi:MAG: hypothetical protein ACLRSW_12375 [Christensenellaceae bacterium]
MTRTETLPSENTSSARQRLRVACACCPYPIVDALKNGKIAHHAELMTKAPVSKADDFIFANNNECALTTARGQCSTAC